MTLKRHAYIIAALLATVPATPPLPARADIFPPAGLQSDAANATLPAALGNLGQPIYNVIAYGAKCDYVIGGSGTDDTVAINAAAAALRTNGFGILYSPPDKYCYHAGTINLTNLNPSTGPNIGQKTRISVHLMCAVAAGRCVDAIGVKHAAFYDFELLTPRMNDCSAGDDAAVGIHYGRPTPAQTASQNEFHSPYIQGCFSQAAIINYASEVSKTYGGIINNNSPTAGSHNVRADCLNHFNILASAFTTINWPSGQAASCNDISFHGTVSQKGGKGMPATGASGNTLTFASVPASIVAGQVVTDATNSGRLPNGAVVVSTTATTVVLNVGVTSVVNGDLIAFSSPDPAVWLDGVANFGWGGGGYISVNSQYAVTLFYEAAQPNIAVHLPVHIESYPNLIADVLMSGTSATATIFDFRREDMFEEATFAVAVPDFANNVTNAQFDHLYMNLSPAGGVAATFKDFGLYQQVASATVATGGSGCTNGSQTFTLVGGNGSTKATVNGTVSGGALAGALTVPTPGIYQATPGTTPTTTGGGCSVQPTINPTYSNIATQTPIAASGMVINASGSNRSVPGTVTGLIGQDGAGSGAFTRLLGAQIGVPNLPTSSGSGQAVACKSSTNLLSLCAARATSQSQPGNPTGTANTTGLMMGLAGSITPVLSGTIALTISGDIFNVTAIADGGKVQASYGTGTAPANAAAITGTQCGGRPIYIASTTAGKSPFSVNCIVTGLTIGTAYWLDVTLAAVTGGTATIENVSISAVEL